MLRLDLVMGAWVGFFMTGFLVDIARFGALVAFLVAALVGVERFPAALIFCIGRDDSVRVRRDLR